MVRPNQFFCRESGEKWVPVSFSVLILAKDLLPETSREGCQGIARQKMIQIKRKNKKFRSSLMKSEKARQKQRSQRNGAPNGTEWHVFGLGAPRLCFCLFLAPTDMRRT